jgi:large subunit ribosomal protein L22
MKAILKHYKQSPRKVRLVADLIRGKSVSSAEKELEYLPKRATNAITKLLKSAIANAKESKNKEKDDLYIKSISVDKGMIIKRARARARGVSKPIRHRRSHIEIELGDISNNKSDKVNKKVKMRVKNKK